MIGCIPVAQDRGWWQTLVNTVANNYLIAEQILVSKNDSFHAVNFLYF